MRRLLIDPAALEDLRWWIQHDRRTALRLVDLIDETLRDPFQGRGKPEALRFDLTGCRSRRIDLENRLVYEVSDDAVRILSCRFHYHKG